MSGDNAPYYKLEESLQNLSLRVRAMNESGFNPTPKRKSLEELAEQLELTADMLDSEEWIFLESEFDKDPPPDIGIDGWPIKSEVNNYGRFVSTIHRLRDLASVAKAEANSLPDPRARPAIPYAALCTLHIMYQCGLDRPAKSDNSEGVELLRRVCESANIHRSNEVYRNALARALEEFEPLAWPPGLEDLFVLNQ